MLLIYSTPITSRLEYIVQTLMEALGVEYILTTDQVEFTKSIAAKICYSAECDEAASFHLSPVDLLFQTDIKTEQIDCFDFENQKAFLKSSSADFPFDIFAASFYLVSRYEEYLTYHLDSYGRYAHENSIAFKENFLQVPLVNMWLQQFKSALQKKFPYLNFNPKPFTFIPTYDVDIAWSFLNKGLARNIGATLRSIVSGQWSLVKERLSVVQNKQKDPFDIYSWLDELHIKHDLKPVYFFLLAEKQKGYDKNISPSNEQFQNLIKVHSEKYEVGIHPSWQSGDDVALLRNEIEQLIDITGNNVRSSRQHYIRLKLPETYRQLATAGIEKEYSMGYGSINGFRASYCLPYKWFDLEKNEVTNLCVYPFCYMEANSHFEQRYTLQQAKEELEHYIKITKQVDGMLITIMHNHLLGDKHLFGGWKEMYANVIENI